MMDWKRRKGINIQLNEQNQLLHLVASDKGIGKVKTKSCDASKRSKAPLANVILMSVYEMLISGGKKLLLIKL